MLRKWLIIGSECSPLCLSLLFIFIPFQCLELLSLSGDSSFVSFSVYPLSYNVLSRRYLSPYSLRPLLPPHTFPVAFADDSWFSIVAPRASISKFAFCSLEPPTWSFPFYAVPGDRPVGVSSV